MSKPFNASCMQLQEDWHLSLSGITGGHSNQFWISCSYHDDQQQRHVQNGRITVKKSQSTNDTTPLITCDNDSFEVIGCSTTVKKWIRLHCSVCNTTQTFIAPSKEYHHLHPATTREVSRLDISPAGQLGISGGEDGLVRVWETSDGTLRRDLQGHIGDITVAKFFPSGQVVLTGASDTMLKIWRLSDALCAVTLTGHKAAILSASMIDRGRNFVSASRDGTVILWDCASQSAITKILSVDTFVNDVSVGKSDIATAGEPLDERDWNTDGYICAAGCEDGMLYVIDIRSRERIASHNVGAAINTCSVQGDSIAVGVQDGTVILYSIAQQEEFNYLRRSDAPIQRVCWGNDDNTLWISAGDGSVIFWDIRNRSISAELTGPTLDAVYDLCVKEDKVYTICRDKDVRRYAIDPIWQ